MKNSPTPSLDASCMNAEAVLESMGSTRQSGLDQAEAKRRLEVEGLNHLPRAGEKSKLRILIEQVWSPLNAVLGIAAGVSFIFKDWLEGSAVLVVIGINTLIGWMMEWQARRSMRALESLSSLQVKVIRSGSRQVISAEYLVPGDLLVLEAGDVVGADARILSVTQLSISEAVLTGESIPVDKHAEPLAEKVPIADQGNMAFKGTVVTRGHGVGVVTATGIHTQVGQIATLTHGADREVTPLQKKLSKLSHTLMRLMIWLVLLIAGIGILQGKEWLLMLKTGVALAVAAIPEGLPIVATIALARGMLSLAKHQVIVKQLNAVETLGSTGIILTDKTGTLTYNKLDIARVALPETPQLLRQHERNTTDPQQFLQLGLVATLCNNAQPTGGGASLFSGDPMEVVLLEWVTQLGLHTRDIREKFPRTREWPFESANKWMATAHYNEGATLLTAKGAIEAILPLCGNLLTQEGIIPFQHKDYFLSEAEQLADQGLRIVAFAFAHAADDQMEVLPEMCFVGLIAFFDPPRPEVKEALQSCIQAGIRVYMVTGDHPRTACNISRQIGLTSEDRESCMTGQELEQLFQEDRDLSVLGSTPIFARVAPRHKLQLVNYFQQQGYVVAMTGDGINDTPALKKADIGIAMGLRGTEAAREVADMVLKNDSFTSIVLAIKRGRSIFANIRHFVIYLLSCNLAELMVIAVASFGNLITPLLPLQILFVNMITDVLPALALGMNATPRDIMRQQPRDARQDIIGRNDWLDISGFALAITLATLAALIYTHYYLGLSHEIANNMAFYTLILSQLLQVFSLPQSNFFRNEVTRNPYIWWAIVAGVLITLLVYSLPLTRSALQLVELPGELYAYMLAFSLVPTLLIQSYRLLRRGFRKSAVLPEK